MYNPYGLLSSSREIRVLQRSRHRDAGSSQGEATGRICQRRPVTARDGTETGTHAEAARGETTRKDCLSVVRQARGAGSRRTYVVAHNRTNYVTLMHVYEP